MLDFKVARGFSFGGGGGWVEGEDAPRSMV